MVWPTTCTQKVYWKKATVIVWQTYLLTKIKLKTCWIYWNQEWRMNQKEKTSWLLWRTLTKTIYVMNWTVSKVWWITFPQFQFQSLDQRFFFFSESRVIFLAICSLAIALNTQHNTYVRFSVGKFHHIWICVMTPHQDMTSCHDVTKHSKLLFWACLHASMMKYEGRIQLPLKEDIRPPQTHANIPMDRKLPSGRWKDFLEYGNVTMTKWWIPKLKCH